MKKFLLTVTFYALLLSSCSSDEPDTPIVPTGDAERTVLIYAVATNSLNPSLSSDCTEMTIAAPDIAGLGSKVRVLLYRIDYSHDPTLYELTCTDGRGDWKVVKEYDRDLFSTDPRRIADVIGDAKELCPASRYGLIMWSHATGWRPDFAGHTNPLKRSFGQDKEGAYSDTCDLLELADAIPDDTFDYIWWDCCYMGGVEVAYQLRDKCDYMVASPAEVPGDGMPYNQTLPRLASPEPDLKEAARQYFLTYNRSWACSIAVMDMAHIEDLREAARELQEAGERPGRAGLISYSRGSLGPFYDFGQYTRLHAPAGEAGERLKSRFDAALEAFLPLSLVTECNFDYRYVWTPGVVTGISCHYPGTLDDRSEAYYQSLDWNL